MREMTIEDRVEESVVTVIQQSGKVYIPLDEIDLFYNHIHKHDADAKKESPTDRAVEEIFNAAVRWENVGGPENDEFKEEIRAIVGGKVR